jgi:putative endopeptidase
MSMIVNAPRAAGLAAILSLCFTSQLRAQAADDPRLSRLENGVDTTIKPGDDFFSYANGAWLKGIEIPAGKERWGVRDEINEVTKQRVAKLIDDAASASSGTDARKVADFRSAYMNDAAIEARELASLKPTLDNIERVKDKAALTRLLGSMMPADVDPLNYGVYKSSHVLGLSVEPSIHGEKTHVAFLVQGGLGLPDRENYSSAAPGMEEMRNRYHFYIADMLSLAGLDNPHPRAAAVMKLETAIAETQATLQKSARDRNADSVWARADFARNAPGMDWSAFFDGARLGKQQSFVAWQPSAVRGLAELVASQPLDAWKDYLIFHALDRYADVLPHAFAERSATFHNTRGFQRAQRALDATQLAMSDVIGKMYSDQYFPAQQKARVQAMVANVRAAFVRNVEASTWMDPASKAIALAKLQRLYVGVGYPERWPDYSDLPIDPADALGNVRRVEERNYRLALGRLGKPVDNHDWLMPSQQAGAILIFQINAYDFSAALLQSTKFDASASDAANYGAVGAIIGHDVTHFVDVLGADYNVDGAMSHWWTPADSTRFYAAAEPLVQQFSSYRPFPDASVNGKLTETENVADFRGLTSAFNAYRATLGAKAADKDYVRQQDREFFLGFAQAYRDKLSEAAMRKQLENDHAPEIYRVAVVRNFDAWYDAFDVKPGERLYLEPAARVHAW